MGCANLVCGKQAYSYVEQEKLLLGILAQFSNLSKCYSHDFVIKSHKNLLISPEVFLLKYQKKMEKKQIVPYIILEKWKLILYGTNAGNQNYIDCLGFDKQMEEERIIPRTYRFSKGNPFEIRIQDLYFHESYKQIQKDAGRVHLVPQIKQDLFEKVLKKIANHFPQSGYSLGINYIVGYFLLVGMSAMDSFWMFVHLALNQKYLALGFFENQLPLIKVIIHIFKNVLRRKNKQLYETIYKLLQVDDSSWILKWITSFFLSTLPIQFCHYILDYVFTFGILGLAIVAYSLVNWFQKFIFKCDQPEDFIQIMGQLLTFKMFNKEIQVMNFMSSIYSVSLQYQDFQDLEELGDNFYVKYFVMYASWRYRGDSQSRQKIYQLLSSWYQQKIDRRDSFTTLARTTGFKFLAQKKLDQQKGAVQKIEQEGSVYKQQHCQPEVVFQEISRSDDNKSKASTVNKQINNARPLTIKVSSRHRNNSLQSDHQNSQKEDKQEQQDKQDSLNPNEFMPITKFSRRLSQNLNQKPRIRQKMRIKSSFLSYKKGKQERDSVNSQKEHLSLAQFSKDQNLSQGEIAFNHRFLNRTLSFQPPLSKTLPLNNNHLNFTCLAFHENLKNIQQDNIEQDQVGKSQKQLSKTGNMEQNDDHIHNHKNKKIHKNIQQQSSSDSSYRLEQIFNQKGEDKMEPEKKQISEIQGEKINIHDGKQSAMQRIYYRK